VKAFIQDTGKWPLGDRLPIKKPREVGLPMMGYLVALNVETDKKIVVFKGPVFHSDAKPERLERYENLDAVIADGWVVD
jgi:hypothetical protein